MVELDAATPHPIELEGKHAEVWCHDCHEGVREPEYECANCHEAPMEPHFGPVCEDCHTPAGFEGADWGDFEHPMALEESHAVAECEDCHMEGQEVTSNCGDCHGAPEGHYGDECADCHEPTSFGEGRLPVELHPVALVGAHASASCDGCHGEDMSVPEFECMNCHERPENHLPGECEMCHAPEGLTHLASFLVDMAPGVSHELEGRDDCYQCHDPGGQIQPAPSNHVDYINEQCALCHKVGSE
jgi:hypothetical protein